MKRILINAISIFANLLPVAGINPADGQEGTRFEIPPSEWQWSGRGNIRSVRIEGGHSVIFRQSDSFFMVGTYTVPAGHENYADVRMVGSTLVIKWVDGYTTDSVITAELTASRLDEVIIDGPYFGSGRAGSADLQVKGDEGGILYNRLKIKRLKYLKIPE